MENVIECLDITRTYSSRNLFGKEQKTVALNHLSFTVRKGIVFSLLGPNGSGKTTTIRILSTLLTPTSGQARVLGLDCINEASKIRGRIGLILGGDRGLYGRLNAVENLQYFAAMNNMSGAETKTRLKEVLGTVGLTENANRPVEQYSRGMRQRLHIARGLMTNPELIFMDEPTIGLDPSGAKELRQMIPKLVAQGKTILLTTHYMSEADELSTEVAIMNRGAILACGTPSEIKKTFSKIIVVEVGLHHAQEEALQKLSAINNVKKVDSIMDGPTQKLILQVETGFDPTPEVNNMLGENVQFIMTRVPTLEEAYLSIIQ